MRNAHRTHWFFCLAAPGLLGACKASESSKTLETETVASYGTDYRGPKLPASVGKFENITPYLNALFSDDEDRIGNQARTILKTHLEQTGRFALFDRENMTELAQEAELSGVETALEGADIVFTGQVTEFGRKTTGDKQLFGIGGRGKTQTAYSKVSISIVDVRTGRVIESVQGAGEYSLDNREVLGFGSTASYDSTLNGKVLNLSITDAVNKLVATLEAGEWSPTSSDS